MSMRKGMVMDIQRFSIHDGPGIRTTVFLKGCPLRCPWCHNPESWRMEPQIMKKEDGSEKLCGSLMTVDQILEEVCRDLMYYDTSGGGLTVSGGEPLLQIEFLKLLLEKAREKGIHTCIETSGFSGSHSILEIVPWTDLFLFDIKVLNPETHRICTGVENDQILRNLALLYQSGAEILLRCPIIPGINDTDEHILAVTELARSYPRLQGVQLMTYHDFGVGKWKELGYSYTLSQLKTMEETQKQVILQRFIEAGCPNVFI